MNDTIKNILNVVAIITVVFSGFFFIESRYTLQQEFAELVSRVDLDELQDLLKEALEDLYYWRSMSRKYPDDLEIKKKLEEAEENVKDLKERIRKIKDRDNG